MSIGEEHSRDAPNEHLMSKDKHAPVSHGDSSIRAKSPPHSQTTDQNKWS
jgi:hypothetical protein